MDAVTQYLTLQGQGMRLHIVEGELKCCHYSDVSLPERIMAKLFGAGNASFKNVIECAKKSNLTEKQKAGLQQIINEYNSTHVAFKRVIGFPPAASKPIVQPTSPSPQKASNQLFDLKAFTLLSEKTATKIELQFPDSNTRLTLAKGDITAKHTQEDVAAFMNAANDTMYHGGGGTNAAFSKLIPVDYWNSHAKNLKVGECAAMPWPEITAASIHPQVLMHVLGPKVTDENRLDEYEKQVYEGFTNLFSQCKEKRLTSIQLTSLSTGIFVMIGEPKRSEWLERANHALYKAMQEAVQDGKLAQIVLVDYLELPWRDRVL